MSVGSLGISRTGARRGAAAVLVAGCASAFLVGIGEMARAAAQTTTVSLGAAAPFAVLASGAVTGSGTSSVTGDVGGSAVTGLDNQVTGTITTSGNTLTQARADLVKADDAVASAAVTNETTTVSGTLGPGVYGLSGAITVSGPVTLDAGGNADATFIFKTDSTLTTADGANVTLAGGAKASNVFWLAGSSATVDGTVAGTVFGRNGITVRNGANVTGHLYSRGGRGDARRRDGPPLRRQHGDDEHRYQQQLGDRGGAGAGRQRRDLRHQHGRRRRRRGRRGRRRGGRRRWYRGRFQRRCGW